MFIVPQDLLLLSLPLKDLIFIWELFEDTHGFGAFTITDMFRDNVLDFIRSEAARDPDKVKG
jgi:hypothetical protein